VRYCKLGIVAFFFTQCSLASDLDGLFEISLADLGNIQVTTASRFSESLSDTPVAITVISSQMIQRSGAYNLKQLLTRFVPSFTSVEDQNELNVAARGIYTSSQQKILFLLNGRRLNNHSFSMASPDLSMSLDKIAQIEVLRGPASAVYGNVALTAVVNIILKKGQDQNGSSTRLTLGNHGQAIFSQLHGGNENGLDSLYWLNVAKTSGEKINIRAQDSFSAAPASENTAILGGESDPGSYDLGVHYQTDSWSTLFNARRSHYIEPFSAAGLSGEPYEYNSFEDNEGYGPGFGYEIQHVSLQYNQPAFKDWSHGIELSINHFDTASAVVINPAAGVFAGVAWEDVSVSILNTLSGSLWEGEALLGFQYDVYRVFNDELRLGSAGEFNTTLDSLLPADNESIYSVFMQHKRHWQKSWITNVGFRYDYKERAVTSDIEAFSPRLAAIYKQDDFSIKMSAAQSFVDSTYWNRFSTLSSFRGADDLEPERLTTYQISPAFSLPNLHSEYRVTLFYNVAEDFIRRDLNALASEPNFSNAGELKTWGLEQEFTWMYKKWDVLINSSYQHVLSHENYAVDNGEISNVPSITANVITGYELSRKWHASMTLQYIGEQFSPIVIQSNGVPISDPFPNEGVSFNNGDNQVSEVLLIHGQLSYQAFQKLRLDLQVDNALDEEYEQGGTTLHPYPQKGRWYRLSVAYEW